MPTARSLPSNTIKPRRVRLSQLFGEVDKLGAQRLADPGAERRRSHGDEVDPPDPIPWRRLRDTSHKLSNRVGIADL
jgi:hypothetical protein